MLELAWRLGICGETRLRWAWEERGGEGVVWYNSITLLLWYISISNYYSNLNVLDPGYSIPSSNSVKAVKL